MAKVMDAIRAREMAPLSNFLKAEVARRGWSFYELAGHAFGRNEKGNVRKSAYIYGIVKGKHQPQLRTLRPIADALEVPVETLTALLSKEPGAVSEPKAVSVAQPLSPPRPDQFTLTINGEGRATLRLHLVDLSADKALRVMAALTSAGLLPTETNP